MISEVLEFSALLDLLRLNGVSIEKHSTGSEERCEGRTEEQAGDRWSRKAGGWTRRAPGLAGIIILEVPLKSQILGCVQIH